MRLKERFDTFISYRSDTGAGIARSIRTELLLYNNKSCLDVDLADESESEDRIYEQIARIPYFIVVLTPGSLDPCSDENDTLRKDIECAFDNDREVIAVISQGFIFPSDENFPESLVGLKTCGSVELSHIDFYAMMENLVRLLGIPSPVESKSARNPEGVGGKGKMGTQSKNWIWLVAALCVAVVIVIVNINKSPDSPATPGASQEIQPAAISWGGEVHDSANGVTLDRDGNIYVIGKFKHTVDFDPGPDIESYTSNGIDDIYITKFDNSMNYLWSRTWGGAEHDAPGSVTCDSDGNVYVAGFFQVSIKFNGESESDTYISNGSRDMFILKLNPDGDFLWSRAYGGAGDDDISRVIIDDSGNIVLVGKFSETVDFGGNLDGFLRTSAGLLDGFMMVADRDGATQRVITNGGPDEDYFRDIIFDGSEFFYVTGHFSGDVDMDPGEETAILVSNGDHDALLCKFDTNLNLIWAESLGGPETEFANYLTLSQDSEIYVTGTVIPFTGSDPGREDAFLSKYDERGNQIRTTTWSSEWAITPSDVITDSQNNVYISGFFKYDVDFDPGFGEANYYAGFNGDSFLMKLDPDGNFIWVDTWGSDADDGFYELAIDETDTLYAVGQFYGSIDFDPGPGRVVCESNGARDAVLVIYPPETEWTVGNHETEDEE